MELIFSIFFFQVWLLIIFSLLATVGMMTYFGWVYYFKNTGDNATGAPTNTTVTNNNGTINNRLVRWVIWNNFSLHMLYVINIMTNQGKLITCLANLFTCYFLRFADVTGCRERIQRNSYRILAGFWLLAAMVLVNSYSSIVISSLTVPKMKPSIDSLEDLAASEDVDVVLRSDVSTGVQILVTVTLIILFHDFKEF